MSERRGGGPEDGYGGGVGMFTLCEVLGIVGTEAAANWALRISQAGSDILITPAMIGSGIAAGTTLYIIYRVAVSGGRRRT